jgi:tRNA uridine 5-carboxymethylaminomethyl modification enzyme
MFTSRAEFRLHLRIDNADRRLTHHGRRVGLISDAAWADFLAKQERQEDLKQVLQKNRATVEMLESVGRQVTANSKPIVRSEHSESQPRIGSEVEESAVAPMAIDLSSAIGQPLAQLLKRPEITIELLVPVLKKIIPDFFASAANPTVGFGAEGRLLLACPELSEGADRALPSVVRNELKSVETEIKYEGYLQQQQRAIERLKKAEQRNIPEWFDYRAVSGLSREMQETLVKIRPRTLGHASRIPGVTPAAVSLVNVYIEIQAKRRDQAAIL